MLKRLCSFILAVALVVGLSVQGFAGDEPWLNGPLSLRDSFFDDKPYFVDKGDGNTNLGVFSVNDLDDDSLAFWHHVMDCVSGNATSSKYIYIFARFTDSSYSSFVITFLETTNAGKMNFIKYHTWTPFVYCACSSVPVSGTYASFRGLNFIYDSDLNKYVSLNGLIKYESYSTILFKQDTYTLGGLLWTNDKSINSQHRGVSVEGHTVLSSSSYKSTYNGSLTFIDDYDPSASSPDDDDSDINGGDSSEDSSSGSSSGESESNPSSSESSGADEGAGGSSSGDSGGDFGENPASVGGYDLAVWDSVLTTIMPTLKKVAVVCLPLLACLYGAQLLLKVIPWLIFGYFRNKAGWYDKKTLSESHLYHHKEEK